jgi:hypothetical protein
LFVVVAWASSARAEEAPQLASDVRIDTGIGLMGCSVGAGPVIDVALLGRMGFLEGGVQVEAGGGLGLSYVAPAAVFGLGLVPSAKWRIDVLAQLGLDAYRGFQHAILSSDPGANATIPFLGTRVGFSHRWKVFEAGLHAGLAQDVATERVTYSFVDSGIFGGRSTPESRTVDVGTTRYTLMVTLGAGWDL